MAQKDHTLSTLLEVLLSIKNEHGDIPVVISGDNDSSSPFFVQLHGKPKVVKVAHDTETDFFHPTGKHLNAIVCVLGSEEM